MGLGSFFKKVIDNPITRIGLAPYTGGASLMVPPISSGGSSGSSSGGGGNDSFLSALLNPAVIGAGITAGGSLLGDLYGMPQGGYRDTKEGR